MKATAIIKNLINLVGVTVGITITAIGSIFLIGSFLKLYVFGIERDAYFEPKWACEKYDWETKELNNIVSYDETTNSNTNKNKKEPTKEEKDRLNKKYKECIADEEKNEKEKYFLTKTDDMIQGLAFLIVGLPILFLYQKRKKRE